ncbi:MAG: hypothetical protein NTY38_17525, partial [Acidobacteria bacterium]|nr:hypothetical protein [Acidobacteriota bacterium]
WEYWLFSLLVAGRALVCLAPGARSKFARAAALTLIGFGGLLVTSRLQVSEHHLVALIPFCAVVAVLGFSILSGLLPAVRHAARGALLLYVCISVYWVSGAAIGLSGTGGVGQWSDAVTKVAVELEKNYAGRPVTVLDWGLANGLYVLSGGRIQPREVYEQELDSDSWLNSFRNGGLYLINGPSHRFYPGPTVTFLEAVAEVGEAARRIPFYQRKGDIYAELVVVAPVEAKTLATRHKPSESASVLMKDPLAGDRLRGFHQIEPGGWRWTSRSFSISMASPDPADGKHLRLVFAFYVPDVVAQKLGALTLSGRVAGHELAPSVWEQSGRFTYVRNIEAGWLTAGGNRIDFTLDKALPPGEGDRWELGVIAVSATLEPR